ncbi:MAG: hypothetical protein HFF89_04485 [Oscillibacter sp.]|jgi:hypothetical protein|nr:hypothetical protein [Oscillibacter sp.]MCI8691064.1 hypothetical protein [Oscillibacter sp.]MCI9482504.1 hypothetical protein [Oscillibacter sp.]
MDKQKKRFSPPAVGGVSLLVVFAVLCLTVFALLSLTTVQADVRLADASAQAAADYYAADLEAQTILARLRNGERPEGVTFTGSGLLRAEYTCRISDTQELQVSVILQGISGREYVIERWQAVPSAEWESDESLDLWDGAPF